MRGPYYRAGWQRCLCVASGPSLAHGDQKEIIRGAQAMGWRVLVTNSTWRDFPGADLVYGADERFWRKMHAEIAAGFMGEKWTADPAMASIYGLRWVPERREKDTATGLWAGLSRDPGYIRHGGNSGHSLLALTHAFGSEVTVLSGYDFQLTGGHVNGDGLLVGGPIHHHGPHAAGLSNPQPSALASWVDRMGVTARDLAAAGHVVLNATRETALTCFPRVDLAETLAAYGTVTLH